MSRSKIIGAIDIGTSKVSVLIGESYGGRDLSIIGYAQTVSMGMRKGEITNVSDIQNCVMAALMAAEKMADTRIEKLYLAQSGGYLEGYSHPGMTKVSGPNNTVTQEDLKRVSDNAKARSLPPGRVFVQRIHSGYFLDGKYQENPLGMRGSELEAVYWHVHGDEHRLQDQLHMINHSTGIRVTDLILSSVASGSQQLTDVQKKQGALIMDIGSGVTDYVVYKNGRAFRTGVISVGGDHLTNDLSIGLHLTHKTGEKIKIRHGKAVVDKTDKDEIVFSHGDMMIGDQRIPRLAISKILHARVKEIFVILKNRLGSYASLENIPGGIVITGGTSQLPGITEVAEEVFGVPAKLGSPPDWVTDPDLRSPSQSTALGLLYYAFRGESDYEHHGSPHSSSWFSKVKDIFSQKN